MQQHSKGSTVEMLTVGMMTDVCELAKDDAIKAGMGDQVQVLEDEICKLSSMQPSVPKEGLGNTFYSFGGKQFNAPHGTLNHSEGSGPQFPGATIGSMSFGTK